MPGQEAQDGEALLPQWNQRPEGRLWGTRAEPLRSGSGSRNGDQVRELGSGPHSGLGSKIASALDAWQELTETLSEGRDIPSGVKSFPKVMFPTNVQPTVKDKQAQKLKET